MKQIRSTKGGLDSGKHSCGSANHCSVSRRLIAWLLAAILIVTMLPLSLFQTSIAHAADGYQDWASVIEGGGNPIIHMKVTKTDNAAKIYSQAGTSVGTFMGEYGSSSNDYGLSGYAYCQDHTLRASSVTPHDVMIDMDLTNSYNEYEKEIFLLGYRSVDGGVVQARWMGSDRADSWWVHNAASLGVNNAFAFAPESVSDEVVADEFRVATQLALWHAKGQICVEGAYGYEEKWGNFPPKDTIRKADNQSMSQQRILEGVRALTYYAAEKWSRPQFYGVGNYSYDQVNFAKLNAYSTPELVTQAEDVLNEIPSVDFTATATNASGEPNGTIKNAYDATKTLSPQRGVYKQSLEGKEYFTFYWVVYSETQVEGVGSGWFNGTVKNAQNLPAGTMIQQVTSEEMKNPDSYNSIPEYSDPNQWDVYNLKPITEPFVLWAAQSGIDGVDYPDAADMPTDLWQAKNPNQMRWASRFKICVPVDAVQQDTAVNFDIEFVNNGLFQYNVYYAKSLKAGWQPFLIGDPKVRTGSTTMNVKWGGKQALPNNILVYKKDAKNGNFLAGAEFTATSNGKTLTATTDTTGVAKFAIPADLAQAGTVWTIKEKTPPSGYKANAESKTVTMSGTAAAAVTFENQPEVDNPNQDGNGQIVKVDAMTGEGLSGALFHIEGIGNGFSDDRITNDMGVINYQSYDDEKPNYIPPGSYVVTEKTAPAGYDCSNETKTIEFYSDGSTSGQVIFENHKLPHLTILKVDGNEATKPLAGAVFAVYKNTTYLGDTEPTDASGATEWFGQDGKGVTEGTYTFVEKVAPEGYVLNETPQNIYIDPAKTNGVELFLTFKNYVKPALIIKKLDKDTDKGVAGAVFEIYKDGTRIEVDCTTDDEGKCEIMDLEPGTYEVREINPPAGYNLDDPKTQSVEIVEGDETATVTFKDSPYRDLEVLKTDAETGWKLKGATFEVVSADGNYRKTGETDENGIVRFEDLPNGTYTVTETKAPNGYQLLPNPSQTIVITSDSTPVIELEFKDNPKSGILIRKIDSVTKQPLAKVEFAIEALKDNSVVRTIKEVTDANGLIVLEDLEAGWYRIMEVTTVDGYILNTEPQLVYVDHEHNAITVTFENNQKGMLNILKLDAETNEPLSGAIFSVSTAGGNHIATVTTGVNGYGTLPNLKPGSYVVKELEAPDGHLIDPTPQTFEVSADDSGKIYMLIFHNSPETNLYLRKYDAQTNMGLAGAVFKVTLSDGTIVKDRVTSGEDGLLHIGGLKGGTYIITEIQAPDGYLLDSTPKTVHLKDGETKTVEFENKQPGGITILKVDAGTGTALPGASFQLFTVDDKLIGTYESDDKGYTRINDLEPGYYFIREYKAPDGYVLNDEPIKVEVKEFGITQITVKNNQNSSLTIQKVDKETGSPLAGATFEIRTMEGELVATLTTDQTGSAVANGLKSGYYVVKEIKAPDGYLLNETPQTVKIESNVPTIVTFENQSTKGIIIRKVDQDTKAPLPGAVFEIKDLHGSLVGEYTTDPSGVITTQRLEPGFYYIEETKAPEGYTLNSESRMVEVVVGKVTTVTVENSMQTTIQIYKTDSESGEPLKGAQFEVKTLAGEIIGYYDTDESGYVYTEHLTPGNYVVTEVKAPDGYRLDSTPQFVELTKEKSAVLHFKNVPLTSILITKLDNKTNQPLEGAVFEIYDNHGKLVGTYTTDASGIVSTEPLNPSVCSEYTVKEVKAPDNYVLDPTDHKVTIHAGKTTTLVVKNQAEATLTIRKIDSKTKEPIAGAVFKVESAQHSLIGMFETDANGEILVTGLEEGAYIITETQAPEGYQIASEPQTVYVKYGINNYVDFVNAENGSLIIILEDKTTGAPLPDGHFIVTRCSDNTIVYEGVTDVTGSIVVGTLPTGKYIITQTYGPDGYTIVDERKDVMITSGTQQTVHFKDVTAGLVIEKIDSITKETLEGARFKLVRNEDNIVIGEYVTDKDGHALVSGLTPGMYQVEELIAPDGYTIDEGPKLVHVKEGTTAHVTFQDTPLAGITIYTVDETTKEPLAGSIIEIWAQNGNLINSYTTDTSGMIQSDKLEPGFYIVKLISLKNGYTCTQMEQTVEVVNGIAVTHTFNCAATGSLNIISTDNSAVAIPGMKVTVTTIDGTYVGKYVTDQNGSVIVAGLDAGYYVITETQAPEGYTVTQEAQTVEVTSSGSVTVTFAHTKIAGLEIRSTIIQTEEPLPGVTYTITDIAGAVVAKCTGENSGAAFASLAPGNYIVTVTDIPDGYQTSMTTKTVNVKGDVATIVDFVFEQLSSLRIQLVDGDSGAGIYGMRLLLKDKNGTVISEHTTDNEGYITLSTELVDGNYQLEQIAVPDGYRVDTIPKTIQVLNGQTTEIVWKCYQTAGQIQVVVTSADYNKTRDLAEGSLLQGAVFEIVNADTYQVVGEMVSDASGIAASNGLPIGRYIVRQITAPAYYAISEKETEVRLKIPNDVVRIEYQNISVNLGVAVEHKSNSNVSAGTTMRYDYTVVSNNSDVRMDNFYLHVKIPTDGARVATINTGTWNQAIWYKLMYKTNMSDYRPISEKLLSTSHYQYDLSSTALGLQTGEYVTDIRYEFGTVPAGFVLTAKPTINAYVLATLPSGYKLISKVEAGGQHNATTVSSTNTLATNSGQWITETSIWSTTVLASAPTNLPSTLPKTGY